MGHTHNRAEQGGLGAQTYGTAGRRLLSDARCRGLAGKNPALPGVIPSDGSGCLWKISPTLKKKKKKKSYVITDGDFSLPFSWFVLL